MSKKCFFICLMVACIVVSVMLLVSCGTEVPTQDLATVPTATPGSSIVTSDVVKLEAKPQNIQINSEENQFVSLALKGDISSLPKTITVVPSDNQYKGIAAGETAHTDVSLPDYRDMVEKYLATDYGIDSVADMFLLESYVAREMVDPDYGVVEESRVVVERTYTYYDAFSGVKVADSFVRVSVDAEGINGVEYNRLAVPADVDFVDQENLVGEDYCSPWEAQAAVLMRYPTASIDSISIAYVPMEGDVHVLCYEFITKWAGSYYVEVSTGNVVEKWVK